PAPTERPVVAAPDFTLTDQYGNTHTLSDYKGKVVFLNFWADWCGYCVEEMPDIQQLYLDEGENTGDVIILGITNGLSQQEMADFFAEKELTYPTLLDTDGSVFATYGAYSLPTTFMIDVDGNVYGYLPGMMDRETMDSIIAQTKGES
ncbi:cytochrome C biogenesis protein, partial [Anaerofilum sp. An201]